MGKNKKLFLALLTALLLLCSAVCLCVGATRLDLRQLISSLKIGNLESAPVRIFLYVRIPRVLAPIIAGACLAVSGVILQGILANPLAAPNIIGVNSGAGFAVVLICAFMPDMTFLVPYAAFFGALTVTVCIYMIAYKCSASSLTIILAGITVSSIMNAGIDAVITVVPDALPGITAFKIGGFSGISPALISYALPIAIAGILPAMFLGYELNIINLGDEVASSLGLNIRKYRAVFIILSAILAGAAVSISGILGFVGLIAPHIVRRFAGEDHRILLPASALVGAIFVLVCDTVARTLFAPYEISVGIILSFLGGPFFLYLFMHKRRKHI